MSIEENIHLLKSKLPENVRLIAVSKTKSNEAILAAYHIGQRDFGENYIQELVDKSSTLPTDINWHFIGHLQRNKVKYIAPFVYLIHGVDSLRLLEEINRQAGKNNRIIPCLLQIYIANEETKFGLSLQEAEEILEQYKLGKFPNIEIQGLMGMASNTDDQNEIELEFMTLRSYFDTFKSRFELTNFKHLSMGMSSDYELALKQGATMLRLGSSIFGARQYN